MANLRIQHVVRSALPAAALLAVLAAGMNPAQAERGSRAGGPFGDLVGSWAGNGTVSLTNGSSERIRCQAAYATGADASNLRSVIRCASDSYKFELASDVVDRGGKFSGAWREATRNIAGQIAGTAKPGELQGAIDMPGFTAGLNIASRGDRQVVSIRSQGTELAGVSITLSRK
jgi:hypothetical protein